MMKGDQYNSDDLLKPRNMLRLYASGAFPMADSDTGEINWYLPDVRTIIPLDNYHVPRSFRKFLTQTDFNIRIDFDFLPVVKGCASRDKTWISDKLIEAYEKLKELGHIHTVETWQNNKLVGGLYGITYKGAFFGESMFSYVPQASKFALVKLLEHLNEKEFVMLDVQYMTEHLRMFGAAEISFPEYDRLLQISYTNDCEF